VYGIKVGITAVHAAMAAIGFTHKKKRSTRRNATRSGSQGSANDSSPSSRS
jgi:hypothetical protein